MNAMWLSSVLHRVYRRFPSPSLCQREGVPALKGCDASLAVSACLSAISSAFGVHKAPVRLQVWEWQNQRGAAAVPQREQPMRLYSAVNAQLAIARAQVRCRLEGLAYFLFEVSHRAQVAHSRMYSHARSKSFTILLEGSALKQC